MESVLLARIYALITREHGTRDVPLQASTGNPTARGPRNQPGASPRDPGARVASVKFLIRDPAGRFTDSFNAMCTAAGARILAGPPEINLAGHRIHRKQVPDGRTSEYQIAA